MENDETTQEVELDEIKNNEEVEETQETSEQSESESKEDDKDWKSEALKYKAILERTKAKKQEFKPKEVKESNDLSTKDLYALIDAKVPEADIEEVREYAQLKKISIAEALKSTVVKSILSDNAEKRKSAEVSSTGSSKRSSGKVSDAVLLEKAMKGELPDSQEDMERLFNLRKGI
jgi:DNA polymerase III alpha subunit (gram-positive type)